MKRSIKIFGILAVVFVVVIGFFVASTGGPVVTVINRSSLTISNIIALGNGFSEAIGTLTSGQERSVSVYTAGESSLRMIFDANGRNIDSGDLDTYFENNHPYKIIVIVGTNLTVTCK
jgi:hypothetical protein